MIQYNLEGSNISSHLPGIVMRPKFEYKDSDEIYIGPGVYHHSGTVEQLVYWDSRLTKLSTQSGDTWVYLYLDDSAIVTAGTNLLTATEFIVTTTAPTWNASKHGWYNSGVPNDRCIFAFYNTNVISADITQFFHDGGDCVLYANEISDLYADIDLTWTDVTLTIPEFSIMAQVNLHLDNAGAGNQEQAFWRVNGLSGATYGVGDAGHLFGATDADGQSEDMNTIRVITDNSQVIEVVCNGGGGHFIGAYTAGYYFPAGM
jgi:hypothetical protein